MVGIAADLRRRVGRAALRHRLRLRRRRPARDLPEGRDLALLAALLHRPAPPRLAAGAPLRDRLGRHPAGGADRRSRSSRRRSATSWPRAAVRRSRRPTRGCGPRCSSTTVLSRRDPDQDLEQRAHRAPAAGAGEAADGGARRRARQSDQPALPVQHADVDLVADPLGARERRACSSSSCRACSAACCAARSTSSRCARSSRPIDEYLDIESIRFGPQLKVEKHIDPATLDLIVPSMILQPLVENSIKHGLSHKIGEGRITIRSLREQRPRDHRRDRQRHRHSRGATPAA